MRFNSLQVKEKTTEYNLPLIAKSIALLSKKYSLVLFYIFGSTAKGTRRPLSDVDCAFLSSKKIDIVRLQNDLEDIFHDDAIDLIDLKTSPPPLSIRIIRDGKCLFQRSEQERVTFETKVTREYQDTSYLRSLALSQVRERLLYASRQRKNSPASK